MQIDDPSCWVHQPNYDGTPISMQDTFIWKPDSVGTNNRAVVNSISIVSDETHELQVHFPWVQFVLLLLFPAAFATLVDFALAYD